jgi:hypothetical protein
VPVVALVLFAIGGSAFAAADLVVNRDLVTFVNTLLNLASVYILVKASREYRSTVAPKVQAVEQLVTQELGHWDGGERRECDDDGGK